MAELYCSQNKAILKENIELPMIIFLSELLQTTMKYIIIINNTKFMEIFRVSIYKSISLL